MNSHIRLSYAFTILIIFAFIAVSISYSGEQTSSIEPAFLLGHERAVWVSYRAAALRKSPNGPQIAAVALGVGFAVIEDSGEWLKVKNAAGQTGYLKKSETSSFWILIEKSRKKLTLFHERKAINNWITDFGGDPVGDKAKRGDNRTPEGEFYVCRKVPNSRFYKGFLLSYPDIAHAERGFMEGIIPASQRAAIVRAINERGVPPQDTNLGGDIEIHGKGTRGLYNWTLGCIAVPDSAIDYMWDKVMIGAPILITP